MADKEHLKILNEGKKAWNAWREQERDVRPDLRGADLRKKSLRNYDLSRAKLAQADLRDVSFRRADLTGADLSECRLYRALFSDTRVAKAKFAGAVLYETVFADVDLGAAKGLDEVVHRGPSVLDHRTMAHSKGVPLAFFRGCGLPDPLIEEARRESDEEPRDRSCFISYCSDDQEFAEKLYAELQDSGVRCWYAPKNMRIGAKIRESIDDAIRETGKVLIVLSESAIASSWVETEFETAFEEERRRKELILFPIRLDESVMKSSRAWMKAIATSRHIGDFTEWRKPKRFRAALEGLVRDLRAA